MENNRSFFNNASFILNRTKLLEFINSSESERFKAVSKMCGFDDLATIQTALNQSEKHFNGLLKDNESKLSAIKREIYEVLEIESEDEIYSAVNKALYDFKKEVIDENTDLEKYLDSFDISSEIHLIKQEIEKFDANYKTLEIDDLEEKFNKILDEYVKNATRAISTMEQANMILKSSKSFINSNKSDRCPVCERELTEDILDSIVLRISEFDENLKKYNDLKDEIQLFKSILNRNWNILDKIIDSLRNINYRGSDIEFVEKCRDTFKNLSCDLDNLINFKINPLDLKDKYDFDMREGFDNLESELHEFNEKESDASYSKLKDIKTCIEKLKELTLLKQEVSSLKDKYELSCEIKLEFDESNIARNLTFFVINLLIKFKII